MTHVPRSLKGFADEVKQICTDFSDLQNRPYMSDVVSALDGLLDRYVATEAALPTLELKNTLLTDQEIQDLYELSQRATPGQWWIDSHGMCLVSHGDHRTTVIMQVDDRHHPAVRHPETGNLSHWPNDWDASFIVGADPLTIQRLIHRLRAAEAQVAELQAPPVKG